jgi:hypothetical protein
MNRRNRQEPGSKIKDWLTNYVRLRNALMITDWQRLIRVSKLAQRFRHELVTRHRGHCVQHETILNIPPRRGELLNHPLAGYVEIRQLRTTDRRKDRLEEAQQKQ